MEKKLQLSDINFRIEQFSPDNELLPQYFQLRFDVYNSYNMPFYAKPTSTRWDRHPDTRFLLLINKTTGKVVGGRRFIIHQPNSITGIYSEENTGFQIEEMLPHLDANAMRFAEFGALCFSPELRGIGASEEMYANSFAYMREQKVDFIVSNPITKNYERLRTAALANGIVQFVRRDDLLSFEDGDDEPTVFMSFKSADRLNLTPPAPAKKFRNGIATNERQLLQKIFDTSFVNCVNGKTLNKRFFSKKLTLKHLQIAHDFLQSRTANLHGREIEAAHRINTAQPDDEPASMLLIQLHGNEPSGLAAFLYALALRQANLLKQPVLAMLGNKLAASQFFQHWAQNPQAPQASRDVFRRGVDENGEPYPDMNRLPLNFRELPAAPKKPYIKRWQEMDYVADNVTGIVDIHSARAEMVCVTDSSDNSQLKFSNIRSILVGLTEAIGAATASETFKTTAGKKPNIKHQFGIESGTHEDHKSYRHAAEFAAALWVNIGVSNACPVAKRENGAFFEYRVKPKINFADLTASAPVQATDSFITVKEIDGKLRNYQYGEMEKIKSGQIVARSTISATTLAAPFDFSTLFITKSAEVFDDAAIGLYPVSADKMDTKFCYPCTVKKVKI